MFSSSIGSVARKEGLRPHHPIVIVPGFASSGLEVEAGYEKWVNKRVWLSVTIMSKSKLSAVTGLGNKTNPNMVDPLKMFAPGYLWMRHGFFFFKKWTKYWFALDFGKKTLYWYESEESWVQEKSPGKAAVGKMFIGRRSMVHYGKHVPEGVKAKKGILWIGDGGSLQLACETEAETSERIGMIALLLLKYYPEKKKFIRVKKEKKRKPKGRKVSTTDEVQKNMWLRHLSLSSDCMSDPEDVRVRAIKGLKAVDYLDPGTFVKDASYVFAHVIDELKAVGYKEGVTLEAAAYDWRVPPKVLQERDGYFDELREKVEVLYLNNANTPVVLLAHSMGNKVCHYFLLWMKAKEGGQEWIDTHVHTLFSVGAPWLGATKSLRGVVSGDKMGLDAFLSDVEAIQFARSLGSPPWLFPAQSELISSLPSFGFAHIPTSEAGNDFRPTTVEEVLDISLAHSHLSLHRDVYGNDPFFGDFAYMHCPPVNKLYCVYGTNLNTEVSFYCKTHSKKSPSTLALDTSVNYDGSHLICENGIVYEHPQTAQPMFQFWPEMEGSATCGRSGDGTVPYGSLAYCMKWKREGRNVEVMEIPEAPHREILEDALFIRTLVYYACNRHVENPDYPPLFQFSGTAGAPQPDDEEADVVLQTPTVDGTLDGAWVRISAGGDGDAGEEEDGEEELVSLRDSGTRNASMALSDPGSWDYPPPHIQDHRHLTRSLPLKPMTQAAPERPPPPTYAEYLEMAARRKLRRSLPQTLSERE